MSRSVQSVRARWTSCERSPTVHVRWRRSRRRPTCGAASPNASRPRKPRDPSPAMSARAADSRLRWPELIAASLLLVLVSGWAALRLTGSRPAGRSADLQVGQPAGGGAVHPDVVPASFDDTEYDAAVADLQRALQSGRGQLDPATVKVVEENLAIIDQAVDDARRALARGSAELGSERVSAGNQAPQARSPSPCGGARGRFQLEDCHDCCDCSDDAARRIDRSDG